MTDEPVNPFQEEADAILAIAASRDGALLHRYLRRVLETVVDIQETGALYAHNGRRSLARDLMRMMAEGLDAGRTDPGNDPILARNARPVHVSSRVRRDPNQYPRVDSYPDNLNPDGSDRAANDGAGKAG